VLILPPCVNRSSDRFSIVDPDALEFVTSAAPAGSASGGIRVPLTAIRGLSAGAVRHILQMRAAFGAFTRLLDFLRRMEPHQISRRELQVLSPPRATALTHPEPTPTMVFSRVPAESAPAVGRGAASTEPESEVPLSNGLRRQRRLSGESRQTHRSANRDGSASGPVHTV
jgi:helix-hairpin-helix protein